MFGFGAGGGTTIRKVFTGASPSAAGAFVTGGTLNITIGDISVAPEPVGGFWYAVGLIEGDPTHIRLFRNTSITNDGGWVETSADVFGGSPPVWAVASKPDPNLSVYGGKVYLTFTSGFVDDQWSTGIALLDVATGLVVGDVVRLQAYGTYTPEQHGKPYSDVVLLEGHDATPRLYGYTNPITFDLTTDEAWAAFDLVGLEPVLTLTDGAHAAIVLSDQASGASVTLTDELAD
jgi:hypothetical protein